MSINDISVYMRGVLEALKFAHLRGIMHRDIKPGNIMFDLPGQRVSVVDWGLAEYYIPNTAYHVRVATRNYKGPELLFNFTHYGPSLDIWCLGCTFASLLFRRIPFFTGADTTEQILRLAEIFGGKEIIDYVEKYSLEMPTGVAAKITGKRKKTWPKFLPDNAVATDLSLSLLERMLRIDHNLRISAADALNHPFFSTIPT
jgi:casein kinase II subunit alpha